MYTLKVFVVFVGILGWFWVFFIDFVPLAKPVIFWIQASFLQAVIQLHKHVQSSGFLTISSYFDNIWQNSKEKPRFKFVREKNVFVKNFLSF